MKIHTFIDQMNCKINRTYSQDIDKVKIMIFIININVVLLVAQRKASFIASLQHNCFQLRSHKKVF